MKKILLLLPLLFLVWCNTQSKGEQFVNQYNEEYQHHNKCLFQVVWTYEHTDDCIEKREEISPKVIRSKLRHRKSSKDQCNTSHKSQERCKDFINL